MLSLQEEKVVEEQFIKTLEILDFELCTRNRKNN